MSKKTQHEHPSDDWAGLAQNLFGINLDKSTGDEDLLDEDMFKVELPKPPEPPPPIQTLATAEVSAPEAAAPEALAAVKPVAKAPPKRVSTATVADAAEPFGFGVLDEAEVSPVASTPSEIYEDLATDAAVSDEGLTLAEDDGESFTLPPDYDDGLTLAPEAVESMEQLPEQDEEEDEGEEEGDTEVLPIEDREGGSAHSPTRRRRYPRRTREDAYWDMLENWEWEEIPDSESPSAEGEAPRFRRGDRGGRGDRGRRDRGREERPRSEDRSRTRPQSPIEARAGEPEVSPSDVNAPKKQHGERSARPRRGDRSRDDRGPSEDRPHRERGPRPHAQRSDESRPSAPPSQPSKPAPRVVEDFGAGIFESESRVSEAFVAPSEPSAAPLLREEIVAQSSQAADAVLRDASRPTGRSVEDDLVWPDDDSDVRPVPAESVIETSRLPAAESAGESDETMAASDVEPLESEDDESFRPRRRRRRRGERPARNLPPDGNEGTTFDISEALESDSETPDFIPSTSAEDAELSETPVEEGSEGEERFGEQRGGRRRRRRRRRPGERIERESATKEEGDTSQEDVSAADVSEEEEFIVKPIVYSNIPSWEEAIRYLLQPHLVGRNLGPEDEGESLENDPRGSGGAEPTSAPPPPRRRGGRGGGRGRRP